MRRLPVALLQESSSLLELFESEPVRICNDWYGRTIAFPVDFYLALSPQTFFFGASAQSDPVVGPASYGQFVEGLWNYDVVELFVGELGKERYLELNLSPNGAWWMCEFDRYREARHRSSPDLPHVETWFRLGEGSWKAGIAISRTCLSFDLESATTRANFCGILGRGEERQYLTFANPPEGIQPDFHRSELLCEFNRCSE